MQSFNTKKFIISFLGVLIFYPVSYANAVAPDITAVTLSSAVGTGFNVVAADLDNNACAGIFLDAGATTATSSTTPPTFATAAGCTAAKATMAGTGLGYGTLLISADASSSSNFNSEFTNIDSNMPTKEV